MNGPIAASEILAALPAALLVIDDKGLIRIANGEAEAILNMSASALIDRPLKAILSLPDEVSGDEDVPFAAHDVDFSTRRSRRFRADIHATALPDHAGWRLLTITNARDHLLGSGREQPGRHRHRGDTGA
jgi:two-component system, NtrC family, nitrogen regulation sensor histidine kinase GlnL